LQKKNINNKSLICFRKKVPQKDQKFKKKFLYKKNYILVLVYEFGHPSEEGGEGLVNVLNFHHSDDKSCDLVMKAEN